MISKIVMWLINVLGYNVIKMNNIIIALPRNFTIKNEDSCTPEMRLQMDFKNDNGTLLIYNTVLKVISYDDTVDDAIIAYGDNNGFDNKA